MTELVESGILTRRVKAARLKVASIQDRAQKQQQEDRVRVVVQRIREVRQELAFQKGFRELLQQEGVQVRPIPKRLKDKAVNDKRNLRTAATRLRNPDVQVVDVADSNSVVKALDVAQEIRDERENAFEAAYRELRSNLCPDGLLNIETDGISTSLLKVKIQGWQRLFRSERSIPLRADVASEIADMKRIRAGWGSVQDQLKKELEKLPEEVTRFLRSASNGGAQWSMITPLVRAWLDADNNGTRYLVNKVTEA